MSAQKQGFNSPNNESLEQKRVNTQPQIKTLKLAHLKLTK